MIKKIYEKRYMLWYMLCFYMLGIIDQARCSADGYSQLAVSNCVGLVIAGLLLPSLKWEHFKNKVYCMWTVFALVAGGIAGVWGWHNWVYRGQWITGVLNVIVWGYLFIYIIQERKNLYRYLQRPMFWGMIVMFLLMFLSRHEGILPLWMLFIFGGFYVINIPENLREDYLQGMLNGFMIWFFQLQILAFGFRPYDYPRYRGFYRGETQNGIFYMMSYCVFLCKWICAKENGKGKIWVGGYFILSAASISFLIFTGGRSSLMGSVVVTFVIYFAYDRIFKKKLWLSLGRMLLLGICTVLLFPIVYCGIRYLPTVLHHPVWFAGEYSETTSVRSFDSWNSERYISFEEAVDVNIGRILAMFGVDIYGQEDNEVRTPWVLKVYASTMVDPGSDPEHPYGSTNLNVKDSIAIRKEIYKYYISHLNLFGHSNGEEEFYLMPYLVIPHTHNLFLQMAYDYGIFVGLLFLFLIVLCFKNLFWWIFKGSVKPWSMIAFLTAILIYGLTEMALVQGMITWVMLYTCLCYVQEK